MFNDEDLLNHLKTENTLQIESLVTAEWNLNDLEKISNYGTYRYRPNGSSAIYTTIPNTYDSTDEGNYYTDALESTTISETAVDDNDASLIFTTAEVDRQLYFSLKECFQPFRPRSGINKALWFNDKYVDTIRSARRPRYYLSSRYDKFKYWNSYRKENGVEKGISSLTDNNGIGYAIEDAAPFVIYNTELNINRIVIKMQTNLAEESRGTIRNNLDDIIIEDPLGDRTKSSIPKRWKVQYLDLNNNWEDAIAFDETSLRRDETDIIKWDGYLELYYGLIIPDQYKENFNLVDYLSSSATLVDGLLTGEAYIVGATETDAGELYIWNSEIGAGGDYEIYTPQYGFDILEDNDTRRIGMVRTLTDPLFFNQDSKIIYRDIVKVKGLRIVVETMTGPNTTFDLIELSPRLKANISDYVVGFELNKSLAKTNTGLPVGGLVASTGQVTLINYDGSFNENNTNSLVKDLLKPNIKIDFYEGVLNVDGYDKFIPIKSLYTEEFPIIVGGLFDIQVPLRDSFFRLETADAPSIILTNITLTKAVAVLLDNIGFSNYIFKNITSANDPVIPYFFVEPDVTVAEVLERLAIATQTAMFFDENNDFIIMTKEYLMPEEDDRVDDYILYAEKTATSSGSVLPNILNIEGYDTKILNNGKINYTTRYIQRSAASLNQATKVDQDRTYIYKPVLLWEVGNEKNTKTINEQSKTSGYSLGAVALNKTLSASSPYVENNIIKNNIIDLGENIYWLPRFQGYLYANGEIIRYDAVEYIVPSLGSYWITNNQEYQKYFADLPFNGKMYPTGNVRIYTEPYYEIYDEGTDNERILYKNGEVKSHGRGQFSTDITVHESGLSDYWSDNNNVRGLKMSSNYLFTTTPTASIAKPTKAAIGAVGVDNTTALTSSRTGILANFMRQSVPDDNFINALKTTESGTIQSSAFVFTGPTPMPTTIQKRDFMTYVYKPMEDNFKHFGTRMRIIGKSKYGDQILTPQNPGDYYTVAPQSAEQKPVIEGGSGGIGVMVNPSTNCGYFFEIVSLTGNNLEQYTTADANTGELKSVVHNVLFYQVRPGVVSGQTVAVPYKLWGGLAQILVDEGRFVGNDRITNIENPTVYDLAVEYENIGSIRRFYLYINNSLIQTVDDTDPLPIYNNIALFTRGSSKCMFDNVYALRNLQSKESSVPVIQNNNQAFTDKTITSSQALRTYAISGLVQSSYLKGISAAKGPQVSMYFEEFGTIFRECAYFNIKYDKAYPAFLAFMAPTFNSERTYSVSGFKAGSYGAEFLIFNNTDKAIVLDETSGSYLRIIGVTFTQNTTNVLTVDDYFKDLSNFSDPIIIDNRIKSPQIGKKTYENVKLSRSKYGDKSFSLESVYIQNDDLARNMMEWIIKKTIRPRKNVYLETFGTQHIQLGDIIKINYTLPENDLFIDPNTKFVVSEIFYSRASGGANNRLRLVEV